MTKLSVLCLMALALVMEVSCQRFIYPTYRPSPAKGPIIRTARAAEEHQGLTDRIQLLHDEHTRIGRSLGTPGRGRVGSNDRGNHGSGSHDTGATHPGYNRRNARSVHLPNVVTTPPFNPKPWPGFVKPDSRRRIPILFETE